MGRALLLYSGAEPSTAELQEILDWIEQHIGARVNQISTFYASFEPDIGLAQAHVVRMEDEGKLPSGSFERTIIRSLTVGGAKRILAVVPDTPPPAKASPAAAEHWSRPLIREHLAKLDKRDDSLSKRPGWGALSSEAALSFVAEAHDGATRRIGEVQIAVNHFHATVPRKIRKLMGSGYLDWMPFASVVSPNGDPNQPDVAHWMLCTRRGREVVHLGYFAPSVGTVVLPWDLLTDAEQREVPRVG